jgi:2-aminoethylphosphonate-pyruvate transaminase
MKLLNPGPVTLTARVRQALLREDMCHREQDFADLTLRVTKALSEVYEAPGFTPVLLSTSGTGAVEAMLSLIDEGSPTLVVANGVYGERAAAMLKTHKKPFQLIQGDWLEGLDVASAEQALSKAKAEGKPFAHVFAVHHETTTGRLNDVAPLGALCKRYSVPMLLDAVSSFGGELIDFEGWNLEACAATANKCLHGVPGIAFVVAKETRLARGGTGATSVYLDLFRYWKEQKTGFSPFTQAVQSLFALDEALAEFFEQGGAKARNQRYRSLTARFQSQLAESGISTFLDDPSCYSAMLTSYRLPKSASYTKLHDRMRAEGFIIYAGQGSFSGQMFRIAVMGDLHDKDVDHALRILREELASHD